MAFLFLAIIVAFVLIAYFLGNKDLLSPWFLVCLAIFASYAIVLLNYSNWDVNINGTFILYVTTAVLAFGIGSVVVKTLYPVPAAPENGLIKVRVDDANLKRRYPANLFILISIVCAALYIFKLLSDAGDVSSLNGKIRAIYEKIVNENYDPGFIFNQALEVVIAVAYVNTYRLFMRLFSKKDKLSIFKLLIPIIVSLAVILISSDRNIFIRYAIYSICLFVLFFIENYKKKNANLKIVQIVIVFLLVFVLAFFLLGKTKQYSSGIFSSLSIYGGSGLYDFNLWIEEFNEPLMYGKSTFYTFLNSLQTILKPFGFDASDFGLVTRFDPFINYTSQNGYYYSSNIYTALKPYVEDFGYLGVIVYPFIIGAFYQWLFLRAKKSEYGFNWILYCMLLYPIIYFPIGEQLFRRFHLGFIYEIGWCAIIYFSVFGRKIKKTKVVKQAVSEERCDEKR